MVTKAPGKWAAIAPEYIKAEDLSLKIIILIQVKTVQFLASTIFSFEDTSQNGLLNLKNALTILQRSLDGSDAEYEKNPKQIKYEKWLNDNIDLVMRTPIEQNKFFQACMSWYGLMVPQLDIFRLLPEKIVDFSFDRGFIDSKTGEVIDDMGIPGNAASNKK